MAQKSDTTILILSFVVTAGILGGGLWWLSRNFFPNPSPPPVASPNNPQPVDQKPLPPPPSPSVPVAFAPPTEVAAGTRITVDGSTSMVLFNQALKRSFEREFSGTIIETDAKGTDKGILALLTGKIDIAAISRPLNPEEEAQGLRAIPVAQDRIAIVIGANNPFKRSLSRQQIAAIFQGKITNWSAVRGMAAPIRVINRPPISGTHQAFQQMVLGGESFGTSPNITTLERDATTPILQSLGKDGISYATFDQVVNQKTVSVVPVDGMTPESPKYPFQRPLYYVYKEPASPEVRAFMGYVTSPAGQQAIAHADP